MNHVILAVIVLTCVRQGLCECEDQSRHCYVWGVTGLCFQWATYMTKKCPVTCRTCPKICVNSSRYCNFWVRGGLCLRRRLFMKKKCQKGCGFCT